MIGKSISHYTIIEKLGAGGMGVLYKAEDTKLKRPVALKFLPPELTRDAEAKERFSHEAQAASALDHPNICTVYEIGETDEGQSYIALAYYEGESLRSILDRGPMTWKEAVDTAAQIARGLGRAHEAGIIHRDVKPANIMITDRGEVKIVDFGLAKLAGTTKLTKEGTTLGTIEYMSPEQARGKGTDHRTDIWSLGVVLYEMLTGRAPFAGEYDQAVVYSILNEDPEPLSALAHGVPAELERIVFRCLEKDPTRRYQSAEDLAADLRGLQNISTDQRPTVKPGNKRAAARRGARWWLPAVVLGAVVILAVATLLRFFERSDKHGKMQPAPKRKKLVVLPFENLGQPEDEYFADGITEEITSRLAALHGLGVISRTSALHYKGTDKTIRQIGEELGADYVLEGTVRWERTADGESRVRVTPQLISVSDDTHIWADGYDERFEGIFAVQSEIAEKVAGALDITLSGSEQSMLRAKPTDNIVAYQAYLKGIDFMKYSHAPEENYRNAQQMLERAVAIDPRFTLAYVRLAESQRSLYFYGYDATPGRLERAKAVIDRAYELQPDLPEVHRALGYFYYQGHLDYDRALEELSAAAKSLPNDFRLLADIAYIWRRQGNFQLAITNLEQAVSMNPKDAAFNTLLITELGYTYIVTRRYEEGIRYCDEAISTAPDNQWPYLVKALAYWCWTGDLEKARSEIERSPDKRSPSTIYMFYLQELFERSYAAALDRLSDLPDEAIKIQTVFVPKDQLAGQAYDLMGDSARAKSSFESALLLLEEAVRERPDDPRVHGSLGRALAGLGRRDEAIRAGKRAVELYPISKDALLGTDRVMDLILIYAMVGEYEEAIERMEYLLSIPAYHSIHYFDLLPHLDPVREHPEYRRLVREHPPAAP